MSLPPRPPLPRTNPLARAFIAAIQSGDQAALAELLAREPWLALARFDGPDDATAAVNAPHCNGQHAESHGSWRGHFGLLRLGFVAPCIDRAPPETKEFTWIRSHDTNGMGVG